MENAIKTTIENVNSSNFPFVVALLIVIAAIVYLYIHTKNSEKAREVEALESKVERNEMKGKINELEQWRTDFLLNQNTEHKKIIEENTEICKQNMLVLKENVALLNRVMGMIELVMSLLKNRVDEKE